MKIFLEKNSIRVLKESDNVIRQQYYPLREITKIEIEEDCISIFFINVMSAINISIDYDEFFICNQDVLKNEINFNYIVEQIFK